jgi:RNA recognition motif-containing protein
MSSDKNTSNDDNSTTVRAPLTADDLKEPRLYVGNLAFNATVSDLESQLKSHNLTGTVTVITYKSGRSKGCAIIEFSNKSDAATAANKLNQVELNGRKIYLREDREEKGFADKKSTTTGDKPKQSKPATNNQESKENNGSNRGGGRGRGTRGGRGGLRRGAMSIFRGKVSGRGGSASRGGDDNHTNTTRKSDNDNNNNNNSNNNTKSEAKVSTNDGTNVWVGNLSWETTGEGLKTLFNTYGKVVSASVATHRNNAERSRGYGTVKMSSISEADAAIQALNDKEFEGRKLQVRKDKH